MPLLPPIKSAAIQILQQSKLTSPSVNKNSPADNEVVATANGIKSENIEETKDYWDINTVSPTQMKINLIKEIGEAFGLNEGSFSSFSKYATAIEAMVEKIREDEPERAFLIIHEIEKELGLDELGLSLDTVVEALLHPGGQDDKEFDAALKEKADDINGEFGDGEDGVFGSLRIDGNGIYSLFG